jgi:AraC-like DNA-binding protein
VIGLTIVHDDRDRVLRHAEAVLMLPAELALRTGTAAIWLIIGIVLLRDWRRTESGLFGGLLALSVAIASVDGIDAFPWLHLQLLAIGIPALFWIWTGAVFVDDFRPSWRDALAWAVLPLLAAFGLYVKRPWIGTAENILILTFILLAAWRTLAGLRDDLVERRRRLRPLLVVLAVLYNAGVVLRDIFGSGPPASASGRIVEVALLAALALGFALMALRAAGSLAGPPVVETERSGPHVVPTPATEADDQGNVLLARLLRLMREEKVYRQEGFGLNALVTALDLPEYRLRRLIHQRLGHRNFSSFVNGYRLAEVTEALADPGQADVPILTIALDAGFQSIGPFNRAFKAHTGMTPTTYRKQADFRTDRPISGIGQAATENGKT